MGNTDLLKALIGVQHYLNPLHVYCRLLDRGLHKNVSILFCKYYEILIFIWLNFFLKSLIHFYMVILKHEKI